MPRLRVPPMTLRALIWLLTATMLDIGETAARKIISTLRTESNDE